MDWSICIDPIRCAEYMAKYTAKSEKISETTQNILNQVLKLHMRTIYIILNIMQNNINTFHIQDDILTVTPLHFLKSAFMKLHALRDYAAYEVAHHNLGLPFIFTSMKFELVSLLQNRTLDLSKLRKFQTNHQRTTIIKKTLLDYYATRVRFYFFDISKLFQFLIRIPTTISIFMISVINSLSKTNN